MAGLTEYLRVDRDAAGALVAVEAVALPAGAEPADCFVVGVAETLHPRGSADLGWAWDGSGFVAPVPRPAPAPPTIADLLAHAAARRYAAETGGIVLPSGARIDTGRDSQAMISGAVAYLAASSAAQVRFKAAAGFVTLTAAEMTALGVAVGAHVQACFAAEADLAAAITAEPPGITATAEIDAAFAALQP